MSTPIEEAYLRQQANRIQLQTNNHAPPLAANIRAFRYSDAQPTHQSASQTEAFASSLVCTRRHALEGFMEDLADDHELLELALPVGSIASSAEEYIRRYALKGVNEDLSDNEELPELGMPEGRIVSSLEYDIIDPQMQRGTLHFHGLGIFMFYSNVNTRSTSPQSIMVDLSDEEDLPELASRLDGSWDNDSIDEFD
jgi:hypothetical protein